jgi:hypothetical protein
LISNNLRRTLRGDTILNRAPGNVDAFQDGIHLDFVNNYHYTKAPGAAPNVAPLTSLFTFTRAGTATFLGRSGLIETAAANVPRIEYDGNGRCLGLLMEVARTNLALQSEAFDNASWTKVNASISANTQIAPDGTLTADTLVEDSLTAIHRAFQDVAITANSTNTVTIWAKPAGRDEINVQIGTTTESDFARVTFNVLTGLFVTTSIAGVTTVTSTSVDRFANGWFRVRVTGVVDAVSTTMRVHVQPRSGGTVNYLGNGTSGLHIWGAQIEAGAGGASSYIPTTTVAVTRPVDVCFRTLGGEYVQGLGTMVAELRTAVGNVGSGNQFVARFSDASFGNAVAMSVTGFFGINSAAASVFDGGASDPTALVNGQSLRGAVAFATNNLGVSLNGGVVYLDTAATMPTGLTRLDLCHDHIQAVSNSSQGIHFRRFHYFPERRSNGYLQQWSRP